jgi:RHS repeat-associated protein
LTDGTNTYTYGLGRISQEQSGNDPEYFLGDALGSVRQMTSPSGQVTYAKSYDPYGVVTQASGAGQSVYGFTGEQQDSYIKLIYLRSRMYSPVTGRFVSRDTWGGESNRPMSLNRWLYVGGNPINTTDPTGHIWPCSICQMWHDVIAWYTGADVGYTGTGWYLGHGPRQLYGNTLGLDQNADNLGDLLQLSLLQYDSATITGESLEMIKQDPEMQAYEDEVIYATKHKKEYMMEFYVFPYPPKSISFGGPDEGGLLLKLKAGSNRLTWMLRHANVNPNVEVTKQGVMTITYNLDDVLDLTPQSYRSFWYNLCSLLTGVPYHYALGGNNQMNIYAHWQTVTR